MLRSSGYLSIMFKAAGADLQSAPLDFGSMIRFNETTPSDILLLMPIELKLATNQLTRCLGLQIPG